MIKMSEIAELANVSVATVSLALNNKKGVGTSTREKILEIANEHDYAPPKKNNDNNGQQELNIQFIVAFNNKVLNKNFRTQPFFNSLIDIIINYSEHETINFSISPVNSDSVLHELDKVSNNDFFDGTIILSTNLSNKYIDECINNCHHPVVFLDCVHKIANGNIVGINNEQGVYLAIDHLIENGHEEIGYVMSDTRINNFEERKNSFKKHVEKFGLNFNQGKTITLSPNSMGLQDEAIKQINNLSNIPTAFFCENDTLAISFIKSLRKTGYNVPDDVSVVGFDKIRESSVITPELTTISINQKHFVKTAIDKLLFSIENPDKIQHTYINCSLSVRNSVKSIN